MMNYNDKSLCSFERVNGWVHPLPLLFAFFSILLSGCENQSSQSAHKGESFPLSELNAHRNLGRESIDLVGKKLVVNFWATWCRPCRDEMPYLQELSDSLDPAQIAIVGVSVDDDLNLVREFLLDYDIRYPNYLDLDRQLAEQHLKISGYPETLLVSEQGVILDRIFGRITPDNNRLRDFLGMAGQAGLAFPYYNPGILPL